MNFLNIFALAVLFVAVFTGQIEAKKGGGTKNAFIKAGVCYCE